MDVKSIIPKIFSRLKADMFGCRRRLFGRDLFDDIPVVVAGSPRSGTTWLGQILSSAPDCMMITEPFWPDKFKRRHGFSFRTFCEPDLEWGNGRKIVGGVLDGKYLHPDSFRDNTFWKILSCHRFVIQSVRISYLLPWMVRQFPGLDIVYLLRHPCAVVSSQMRHSSFPRKLKLHEAEKWILERDLKKLMEHVDQFSSEEEYRALAWALEQRTALMACYGNDVRLVFYEDMVQKGEDQVKDLCERFNLSVPAGLGSLLRSSSRSSQAFSPDHEHAKISERLNRWKERLEPEQVDRILDICHRCGLSFYTHDAYPDHAALNEFVCDL